MEAPPYDESLEKTPESLKASPIAPNFSITDSAVARATKQAEDRFASEEIAIHQTQDESKGNTQGAIDASRRNLDLALQTAESMTRSSPEAREGDSSSK